MTDDMDEALEAQRLFEKASMGAALLLMAWHLAEEVAGAHSGQTQVFVPLLREAAARLAGANVRRQEALTRALIASELAGGGGG